MGLERESGEHWHIHRLESQRTGQKWSRAKPGTHTHTERSRLLCPPPEFGPGVCRRFLWFILFRKALIHVLESDLDLVLTTGWDEGSQFSMLLDLDVGPGHCWASHSRSTCWPGQAPAPSGPMRALSRSFDSEWPWVQSRETVTQRPGSF